MPTKLFESDFAVDTTIATPTIFGSNGIWPITGTDFDTGYTWPPDVGSPGSFHGLQFIGDGAAVSYDAVNGEVDRPAGTPCWKSSIVTETRHDGSSGPVWLIENFQNLAWQATYNIQPTVDVIDCYYMMWVKFPADLVTVMEAGPAFSWFVLAEWKTEQIIGPTNFDYRISIQLQTDGSQNIRWHMNGALQPTTPFYWVHNNYTVPVPVDTWFKFEWAWHRTNDETAWTWVKVDGVELFRQDGGGTLETGFYNSAAKIDRILVPLLYGFDGAFDDYEMRVDHMEFWDGVPDEQPPLPEPHPRLRRSRWDPLLRM